MKTKIYYFSGTGNSMRAAVKIAERLGDAEIISMKADPKEYPADNCDAIGFIYPVYHWTMPDFAVKFVESLTINTKAYIFCVAMPSLICGIACEKLEEIIKSKGGVVSYGAKVYSVANYEIVYPPFPSPKIRVPKTEKKLDKIAEDILNRKVVPVPKANNMTKKKLHATMDDYKELQAYADYGFFIKDSCISCGLCSRVCPTKNISLENGKPEFLHKCAQCMSCVSYCPKRAIGYELKKEDVKMAMEGGRKVGVIKLMGLPDKRKCYRNPYISASDIVKEHMEFKK